MGLTAPDARITSALRLALADPVNFSIATQRRKPLRSYQVPAVEAIWRSIVEQRGDQFTVVFSRQSGKDELLAQLIAFLLVRFQQRGGSIVVATPALRPQGLVSRDRLLAALDTPLVAREVTRDGGTVRLGRASARFVSAAPTSNARGQTADLLLVANEAQDIRPDVWDAVFDPMAASTNATTLFLGTVWSRETLLARQMRHLADREREDGRQRVFKVAWEAVAAIVPAYGERVRSRIEQFGPTHPFIRTEYFLEELDGDGALFSPERLAHLIGTHERRHAAEPGKRYALLIDVGGEEESGIGLAAFHDHGRRDSTALTVVEIVDPEPGSALPGYRVVDRRAWTGASHATLLPHLVDLARTVWRARAVVIDATGVGAGLASLLGAALGTRRDGQPAIKTLPFHFSASSKSALGWELLGLIESGRLKEYRETAPSGTEAARVTATFHEQLRSITYETPPGPGRQLRWGAPTGKHDDLVLSLALVSALDGLDWRERVARAVSR
jgi:hypothetical protein